jgi:hypothetical protein
MLHTTGPKILVQMQETVHFSNTYYTQ